MAIEQTKQIQDFDLRLPESDQMANFAPWPEIGSRMPGKAQDKLASLSDNTATVLLPNTSIFDSSSRQSAPGDRNFSKEQLNPSGAPSGDQLPTKIRKDSADPAELLVYADDKKMAEADKKSLAEAKNILERLDDDDFDTREKGSEAAGRFIKANLGSRSEGLDQLIDALNGDNSEVRKRVGDVLEKLSQDPQTMAKMLGHENPTLQKWSAASLSYSVKDLQTLAPFAEKEGSGSAAAIKRAADLAGFDDKEKFQSESIRHIHAANDLGSKSREQDFANLSPEAREKALAVVIDAAKLLVKDADSTAGTDLGALARLVNPETGGGKASGRYGRRIAELPSVQRGAAADSISIVAPKIQRNGRQSKNG